MTPSTNAFKGKLAIPLRAMRLLSTAMNRTLEARPVLKNPVAAFLFFLDLPEPFNLEDCWFSLDGSPFCARHTDWLAVDETTLREEYRPVLIGIRGIECPYVLDLGANIGMFSLKAFQLNPTAVVHAIEPGRATFQVLETNRRANPQFAWRTLHGAVWTADGEVGFEEVAVASTSAHVDMNSATTVLGIRLGTILSSISRPVIDLVKMDIEGAEEAVLRDSIGVLGRIRNLAVEVHPNRCDPREVGAILEGAFPRVVRIARERSSKPLILASRCQSPIDTK